METKPNRANFLFFSPSFPPYQKRIKQETDFLSSFYFLVWFVYIHFLSACLSVCLSAMAMDRILTTSFRMQANALLRKNVIFQVTLWNMLLSLVFLSVFRLIFFPGFIYMNHVFGISTLISCTYKHIYLPTYYIHVYMAACVVET